MPSTRLYDPQKLQRGLINGFAYFIAPAEILHSWVEVYFNEKWYNMEGLILDAGYLRGLKSKFGNKQGAFCGFGTNLEGIKKILYQKIISKIMNNNVKRIREQN